LHTIDNKKEGNGNMKSAEEKTELEPERLKIGRPVPVFLFNADLQDSDTMRADKNKDLASPPIDPKRIRLSSASEKNPPGKDKKIVRRKKTKKESTAIVTNKAAEMDSNSSIGRSVAEEIRCVKSPNDETSVVQLENVDELDDNVVDVVKEAVEFCLAIQFRSGTTTFKCKRSLTQGLETPQTLYIRALSSSQAVSGDSSLTISPYPLNTFSIPIESPFT
jgi:hypothetical protein